MRTLLVRSADDWMLLGPDIVAVEVTEDEYLDILHEKQDVTALDFVKMTIGTYDIPLYRSEGVKTDPTEFPEYREQDMVNVTTKDGKVVRLHERDTRPD